MGQPLPARISCLLIPVKNKLLLLPNASVAEIVDYQSHEEVSDTPDWFLGFISWRGLRLPLISYESANGSDTTQFSSRTKIVITNTTGQHQPPLSFMAFATFGIPRLVKVSQQELTETETTNAGPADKIMVSLSGEDATIPELLHLEKLAVQALSSY